LAGGGGKRGPPEVIRLYSSKSTMNLAHGCLGGVIGASGWMCVNLVLGLNGVGLVFFWVGFFLAVSLGVVLCVVWDRWFNVIFFRAEDGSCIEEACLRFLCFSCRFDEQV